MRASNAATMVSVSRPTRSMMPTVSPATADAAAWRATATASAAELGKRARATVERLGQMGWGHLVQGPVAAQAAHVGQSGG